MAVVKPKTAVISKPASKVKTRPVVKPTVKVEAKVVAKPVKPVKPVKPAKPAKPVKPAKLARPVVDPEVRRRMIAEAAYYIAEQRGFIHGHHDADWAAAEKQVDASLAQ